MNLFEFIWIYVELKRIKNQIKNRFGMVDDASEQITCRHVAACVRAT